MPAFLKTLRLRVAALLDAVVMSFIPFDYAELLEKTEGLQEFLEDTIDTASVSPETYLQLKVIMTSELSPEDKDFKLRELAEEYAYQALLTHVIFWQDLQRWSTRMTPAQWLALNTLMSNRLASLEKSAMLHLTGFYISQKMLGDSMGIQTGLSWMPAIKE